MYILILQSDRFRCYICLLFLCIVWSYNTSSMQHVSMGINLALTSWVFWSCSFKCMYYMCSIMHTLRMILLYLDVKYIITY